MSVGVGQQLLITDPASFCFQFAASAASEAYLIGVQSVSEVASGLTDVQLVAAKDPAVPAPPPAPPARLTTQGFTRDLVITDRMRRWSAHRETHASFQRRQLESLSHLDVGLPMASGPTTIPTTVVVGDMLAINVPDYNGDVCLNPIAITAEVKHIGAKGVWLEDVANPAGGFSAADYQSLSDQLDSPIYDTDVAEFGDPTDLDANGKIGILVTQEVNKASASLLGFVSSGDLLPMASCAASNEVEVYYAKAPDPSDLAGGGGVFPCRRPGRCSIPHRPRIRAHHSVWRSDHRRRSLPFAVGDRRTSDDGRRSGGTCNGGEHGRSELRQCCGNRRRDGDRAHMVPKAILQ